MSSPHARGSSGRHLDPITPRLVVPARAGIFPRPAVHRRVHSRRPRTRGDLPPITITRGRPDASSPRRRRRAARRRPRTRGDLPTVSRCTHCARKSSPHARGSSVATSARSRTSAVVPARAGIFPRRCTGTGTRDESSPHARGSSSRSLCSCGPRSVVPARAGIFPQRPVLPGRARGRPRTHGDLPPAVFHEAIEEVSSPHARGSSHCRRRSWPRLAVVPARAGIFRRTRPSGRACRGRPRTRGDLPDWSDTYGDRDPSSPHARGSSLDARAGVPVDDVVPARAGIFLRHGCRSPRERRRPRTRGDLPDATTGEQHQQFVVPARAGIFPRRRATTATRTSRPRTRGDLPPAYRASPYSARSSPHARGSSLARQPRRVAWAVVSARAGIFPGRRGWCASR